MPWEFNEADDGRCGSEQVEPPTPPAVYDGDWAVCWLNDAEVSAEEVVRRGALLAAVPDLIAALKKIIEMNRQHAQDQYGNADTAEGWACIVVAREAIAKVEGI